MKILNETFACSDNMLFIPNWKKHDFIYPLQESLATTCFIVFKDHENLMAALQVIDVSARVFILENEQLIESIQSNIKLMSNPHLVFVSQSNWLQQASEHDHQLFLKWLQSLNQTPSIRLSIIACNALTNPAIHTVTHPLDAVYLGLGQTFAKEISPISVGVFNVSKLDKKTLERIKHYPFSSSPLSPIHISEDAYYTVELISGDIPLGKPNKGLKQKGRYLIIGGNGGIGGKLAGFLLRNYQAELILAGRSLPSLEQQKSYSSNSVFFEQLDLTNSKSIDALLAKYPKLDGIIHSALVLDDAAISYMKPEQLIKVLEPKVLGSKNLVNAIAHRNLDFVLFFSSIQSFIANVGQANYTAACLCKDAIANFLQDVFMINAKVINWGYWGNVGIVANNFYRQRMIQQEIGSIEVDEGMAIIEQFLQSDLKQVVVVKGSKNALIKMGLTLHQKAELYHDFNILPVFENDSKEIQRNKTTMTALEQYVRYQFHQLPKPEKIHPRYHRLWEAVSAIKYDDSLEKNDLLENYPEITAHVALLDACLTHFLEIISGELNAVSILFPEGSFHLVEAVYRNNPVADYYNSQVATAVLNFIRHKRQHNDDVITVLEIGAGTGSTSRVVIPELSKQNVHYVYTDLSHAFLNKARQTFQSYHFIEYDLFNVEEPYKKNRKFDIVLATNVIHATKDIKQVLNNVYELMNDGGVFLLNEITERQDFATLTFGLTDGWWLNSDELRIPYSPLLSLKTWEMILQTSGFNEINHHGDFGQHVIAAYKSNQSTLKNNNALLEEQSITYASNELFVLKENTARNWLANLIAQTMHLPANEINDYEPFSSYGIDSLIVLELIKPMSEKVGYIPATILFEYPTLHQLANYFNSEHAECFSENKAVFEQSDVLDILPAGRLQRKEIVHTIKQIVANTMHIFQNELDEETPFNHYGIDSLISFEILKPLQQIFGYLPATIIFEYPTISQLADYLVNIQLPVNNDNSQKISSLGINEEVIVPNDSQDDLSDFIAIIGIAGKFPNADSPQELWTLLSDGQNAFFDVPNERWSYGDAKKSYTHKGAFISNVDAFDHVFFKITPIEAERMDPQERLFLQTTYHAIQDAGLNIESLYGQAVGCYVGVMNHGYSWLSLQNDEDGEPGSLFWSMANRVSYQFNWSGPSFAVDSACSSSLTALHTAVMGIKNGDCNLAVVGGVNLIVHPRQLDVLCQLHMLSRDDQCRPFAANADGFVDGEGVVSIVLKPYAAALAEGCSIYGIIRGTAINSGGKANGYTAPNPTAQAALIETALNRARLLPSDIDYIEAHGTGTELGDPIEVRGLSQVFGNMDKMSLPIGSIKGNVGHLESAAGAAGLIKVLLQMKYCQLVPTIQCDQENPHLNLASTPFYINKSLTSWQKKDKRPLRAAISSFGAGGANAHVIVEAPHHILPTKPHSLSLKHYFFPISAHSDSALQAELYLLRSLCEEGTYSIAALSYGYCCIRSSYNHRAGFFVENIKELHDVLQLNLQQHYQRHRSAPAEKTNLALLFKSYVQSGAQDNVLATQLIAVFNEGEKVDFSSLHPQKMSINLPPYPFDMHRHWVFATESNFHKKKTIIEQHRMLGKTMAPAALTFSMLVEHCQANVFNSVMWKNIITDLESIHIVSKNNHFELSNKLTQTVYSEGLWQKSVLNEVPRAASFENTVDQVLNRSQIYHRFKKLGYDYGPHYRAIKQASISFNRVRSIIEVNKDWGFALSPVLIDAALQSAILINLDHPVNSDNINVPFFVENVTIYDLPKSVLTYCDCSARTQIGSQSTLYDIELSNVEGRVLIALKGVASIKTNMNKLFESEVVSKKSTLVNVFELN